MLAATLQCFVVAIANRYAGGQLRMLLDVGAADVASRQPHLVHGICGPSELLHGHRLAAPPGCVHLALRPGTCTRSRRGLWACRWTARNSLSLQPEIHKQQQAKILSKVGIVLTHCLGGSKDPVAITSSCRNISPACLTQPPAKAQVLPVDDVHPDGV